MATINYFPRGEKELQNISIKLSLGRNKQFTRKSGYTINRSDWSEKTGIKQSRAELKNTKTNLERLKVFILDEVNKATVDIDSDWLQCTIDSFHNKSTGKEDTDFLGGYLNYYLEYSERTINRKGERGFSYSKKRIVNSIIDKVGLFEKWRKKRIMLSDINNHLIESFLSYMVDVDKLQLSTAINYLKTLKTALKKAQEDGKQVSVSFKIPNVNNQKIVYPILTFKELEMIEQTLFTEEHLIRAKDWLLLGCNIGQRIGDLLKLTKDNIVTNEEQKFIELTQTKTGQQVFVPISRQAQRVLDKYDGNFPTKVNAEAINLHIKTVCKVSGIDEMVYGRKTNSETKRKEDKFSPKYELICTHTFRRSFATNYYGIIPTGLLKDLTGHSSEKMFLVYVNKPAIDSGKEVARLMKKLDL